MIISIPAIRLLLERNQAYRNIEIIDYITFELSRIHTQPSNFCVVDSWCFVSYGLESLYTRNLSFRTGGRHFIALNFAIMV
jgi:hypothetical protein